MVVIINNLENNDDTAAFMMPKTLKVPYALVIPSQLAHNMLHSLCCVVCVCVDTFY